MDSVSQLVLNMQHYPVDDYIFGDYIMEEMCQDSITELLSYLTPVNMRIVHISQNNHFDKTSFWYQVPYSVSAISHKNITCWQEVRTRNELYLPPVNPYIVADPEIIAKDKNLSQEEAADTRPSLIANSTELSFWFKQDATFKVPKGYIYINIDSPFAIESDANIAMTRLFIDLYADAIIEEYYDAELAGIHYHLYPHQGGMTLQLSGISAKQGDLLTRLLNSLKSAFFTEHRFILVKKQLIEHWNNADKSKSISQLFSTLSSAMQPKNPSSETLAKALQAKDFKEFTLFCHKIFEKVAIEALVHGNWSEEDAKEINQTINQAFIGQQCANSAIQIPVIDITNKGEINFPLLLPDHDHASVLYYPQKDKDVFSIAKTMITSHLLSPLFFQDMRTEKQYGYLVGVGYVPINRYPGIAFYIQSPHTDSQSLVVAMDEFIEQCQTALQDMSEDDWRHLQHGLAGQLQEKDASLRIKSQRFWAAICNKDNEFSHKDELINAIMTLTLADIITFISTLLVKSSTPDRITLVTFPSSESLEQNSLSGKIINDLDEITNLYPKKH